jgi:hypothetical protein
MDRTMKAPRVRDRHRLQVVRAFVSLVERSTARRAPRSWLVETLELLGGRSIQRGGTKD